MASTTDIGLGKWKLLESGSEERVWGSYKIYFNSTQRRFFYTLEADPSMGTPNGAPIPGQKYFTLNVDEYILPVIGYAQENATGDNGNHYTILIQIHRDGTMVMYYNKQNRYWARFCFYIDELPEFIFKI